MRPENAHITYYETFLKGHYGIEIPNFHSLL